MRVDLKPQQYADVLVLTIAGKINHNGSDTLRDNLLPFIEDRDSSYAKVVLDMSGVEYMSSVGLRVLMLAAKSAKKLERTLVVAGLNSTMREIFEISRFHLLYDTYDSLREAVAALSEEALSVFES